VDQGGCVVEFRLLGPVEMEACGRLIDVGPPQRRTVLAALAVDVGRQVMVETLIDRVWGDQSPPLVRRALQAHVARIRRMLEHASTDQDHSTRLLHRAGGYVLDADPDQVDLYRLHRLVEQARDPDRDGSEQAVLLREALTLWRGEPLAGLAGGWAIRTRQGWRQQHLDTVLAWAHAELRVDNPTAVINPLTALVGDNPFLEPLIAVLMRALYIAGRSAEALDLYSVTRQRLVEELGTEPGAELRRTHLAILREDLNTPEASTTALATSTTIKPATLPPDIPGFTGRGRELAHLDAVLSTAGDGATAVVITVLSGTAGIGKTALALHWAHRVADQFPDGQLYVNLRGFDPTESVVGPADAVRGFLDALAVAPSRVPTGLAAQAALYRSLLAGRRMLVLLDNARDTAQIRPLLPGAAGCLVVVTSRNQLPGLIAADGAHPIVLDLLTRTEARDMMGKRVGPDRVAAEPQAVEHIITRCARLPLALAIVAARAATHPHFPIALLAAELSHTDDGLNMFTSDDPATDVRAVFSWSYRALTPGAARLFRLLGLHPGTDIATHAAASLAGLTPPETRSMLAELARANLIVEHTPGRYTFHDLLRAYATEQATIQDHLDDRHAALTGLFDHYLDTTAIATRFLYPAETNFRARIAPTGSDTTPLPDRAAAWSWLNAERSNLVAMVAHTAAHGWSSHTVQLAATLSLHFFWCGYQDDALTIHTQARDAARRTGDKAGEAAALTSIGSVYWGQGRYAQAAEYHGQAITLFREVGDAVGEARALSNYAVTHDRLGHHQQAAEQLQQAHILLRAHGDQTSEAGALRHRHLIHLFQGRYTEAVEAIDAHLAVLRKASDRRGEARALEDLARLLRLQGRHSEAIIASQEALVLSRETGDRFCEADTLNGLAEAHLETGDHELAHSYYVAALALTTGVGDRHEQARAHNGLARTHHITGEHGQARHHWQQALTLYNDLDVPEADDAREHLATLDEPSTE
jgi:DNA-binding SARP family transcriptional activator/tetratricopeptide (TPR) repeat protein